MTPLMYKGYSVVFQEVPGEVSLAINISGCQHHCPDCHSKYLWSNEGAAFLKRDLGSIIDKYDGLITCVCFRGGDHNIVELSCHANKIKERGLKTCLYTGYDFDEIKYKDGFTSLIKHLDFLKTGRYISEYGNLSTPTTNQRFFEIKYNEDINDFEKSWTLNDITYKFQEKR